MSKQSIEVLPLEWVKIHRTYWQANRGFGVYSISKTRRGYELGLEVYESLEAAQDAAQADLEDRIRPLIGLVPDVSRMIPILGTIGDDGFKPVLARDLEDRAEAAKAQLAAMTDSKMPDALVGVAAKNGCGLPCGYDCNGACFTHPAPVADAELESDLRKRALEIAAAPHAFASADVSAIIHELLGGVK